MRIIKKEFFGIVRGNTYRIVPIGDIHIGAKACNEGLLKYTVQSIADDDSAFWIGMGDYCDFINRGDRRFDPGSLSDWLSQFELDIAGAQVERFTNIIKPIAHKCLGLIKGNHEDFIAKKYERNVYSDIVKAIKQAGGFKQDDKLMLGYGGWLPLKFYRTKTTRSAAHIITIRAHHGYGGGALAGGKALNMERFIWTNEADICLMGHTHEAGMPIRRSVLAIAGDGIVEKKRIGAWTGTFMESYAMDTDTYGEIKGYFPRPIGGVELLLRPGAKKYEDRIRVVTGI